MDSSLEVDVRESFSFNIFLFKLLGFWIPQKSIILRNFYSFYTFVLFGIFYNLYVLGLMAHMIKFWGNIEEMIGVLFVTVAMLQGYFKMYPLIFKAKKFRSLLKNLQVRFQAKNLKQKDIINNAVINCTKCSQIYILFFLFVASLWGIYPLLGESYKKYNVPVMNIWVSFNASNEKVLSFFCAFNFVGIVMSSLGNAAYDTFVYGIFIHIGAQLDILSHSLANIKMEFNTRKVDLEVEEEFMEHIVNCVKHHQEILRFIGDVEDFVSFGLTAGFCASGFVIVVTLFQMTLISPASLEFLLIALYFSCVMFELFMYCWYGNEVTIKSLNVTEAAYNCDWHVCGYRKYQRTLLLLMTRLQKPIVVRAGKLIPLSIETVMMIVKSSWSYFNLLRQVNEVQ